MPTESEMLSRRDSWPPTLLRLASSKSSKASKESPPRAFLDNVDDDPLTYFLTPASPDDEGGHNCGGIDDDVFAAGDMEMDFDAGIEYTGHTRDAVRSVSPSSLEGLAKPPPVPSSPSDRGSSPDQDSDMTNSDDEDYIRFGSPDSGSGGRGSWPWRDLAAESLNYRARSPVFGLSANALLLSPSYFPPPSSSPSLSFPAPSRGRSSARSRRGRQARSLSARGRPRHLWREPSPDVWSIEEETEEEMQGEVAPVNVAAAGERPKLRKKVRFILPPRELPAY